MGSELLLQYLFLSNILITTPIDYFSPNIPIEIKDEFREGFEYIAKVAQENNISIEQLAMVWLLSQKFISSAAYGPRESNHLFNMKKIKELIFNLETTLDFNKLFLYSISEINQW